MQYEVEEILDSKREKGGWEYLIKWKGYGPEHNTWEPRGNLLQHAKKAVEDFHRQHPSAPRPMPRQLRFVQLENYTEPNAVPAYLFNWESGVFERAERISRGRDP